LLISRQQSIVRLLSGQGTALKRSLQKKTPQLPNAIPDLLKPADSMNQIRPRRHASPFQLSPQLCALLRTDVQDPGPAKDATYLSEQEYASLVTATLRQVPDYGDFWIFAYGSLIWKPEFEHVEQCIGSVHGFHRSFCLKTTRWRGTPERPGLMMALQRGGQCRGIAYRLNSRTLSQDLTILFRRELGVKPLNHNLRWVTVTTERGDIRALTFVASQKGKSYVGKLSLEETAAVIARAVGVWGSCAEYLYETHQRLEAFGIRDRGLWKLQALVAQNIVEDQKANGG
jgi:cation transport protein ChaC